MPGWVRKGDANNVGAPVVGAVAATVIVNGRNAALRGSTIATHVPPAPPVGPHVMPKIIVGSATVIVENRPPAFLGADESCGHKQAEASGDVIVPGA